MKSLKEKHIERGGTAETFKARQAASRAGNARAAAARRVRSPGDQLREALLNAFSDSSHDMSEREALEVAESVAEGWRMRLQEIEEAS